MRFGVHTGLQHTNVDELRALWSQIEALEFDWISIWDHFYAADATGDPHCLEAVSMHAALACATTNVRCGSLVYSVGYRHPAVLANALASIDHLSGGRAVLGLGAGWLDLEYRAYGMSFPSARDRLRQLEEAVQCIRSLWNEPSTTFAGEWFTMHDAQCVPKPVQARLPIWIGGAGEKVTLKLAGRYADGWNVPFVTVDQFARKAALFNDHATAAGRDPASLTRSVNLSLAWTDDDLERQFGKLLPMIRPSVLTGSVQEVIDRVGGYRDAGADWVIVAARAPFDRDGIARFAEEVMPAFAS